MKDKKYIKAVAVLIRLTQKGSLKWRADTIYRQQSDVRYIFTSVLKNISLRLTKYWSLDLNPRLEIIDCNGLKIYEFPYTYALVDLFTCVCPDEVQAYRDKILDGIIEYEEE